MKRLTSRLDRLVVAWGTFAVGAPVFGGLLWWQGGAAVGSGFWWAFAVSIVANLAAWPLFVRAIEVSDLSLVMPMLAFTPVFVLGTELVLLGSAPSGLGLVGIALVVVGAYILNIEAGISHMLDPFRALSRDRGAVMMMGVALLWSFSATVEKVTVGESSPAFYLTMLSGAMAVGMIPMILRWSEHDEEGKTPLRAAWGHKWGLVGAGGLFVGMMIAQMYALKTTPVVNYVIAIKRMGLMISVGAGFWLYGEENVLFRSLGVGVMVGGGILIRMA